MGISSCYKHKMLEVQVFMDLFLYVKTEGAALCCLCIDLFKLMHRYSMTRKYESFVMIIIMFSDASPLNSLTRFASKCSCNCNEVVTQFESKLQKYIPKISFAR